MGSILGNPCEGRESVWSDQSITDFGVFIGLDGGIDGLIHLSDLSWSEPGEVAVRKFKRVKILKLSS